MRKKEPKHTHTYETTINGQKVIVRVFKPSSRRFDTFKELARGKK